MGSFPTILYVGGRLPALSETFVTREVLGLRARGLPVHVASVHPPERGLGDARLERLADEAIGVYGPGAGRMLLDALVEALRHPGSALRTLGRAVGDAAAGRVRPAGRPKVLWQALAGLALAHRARALGIEHLHAHMAHVPATIAMYAAMQLGVPFSFTGHAVDIFRERALLEAKLRRASFAACISEWHRELYRRAAPVAEERLPIVRCGIEPDESESGPASGDGRSVLSVARLVPKKGIDLLLRAVASLEARGAAPACQVVGDGPERGRLEALRGELGLTDRVQFLGARSNAEVRALMRSCDLFVLPCRIDESGDRDGIPVVLMEAMAAGMCVVSGDLPAIRELVLPGRTGVLTPPGDADALALAIRDLLADPARRRALGEAGRRHVLSEFSLDRNLDRLQRAFVASQPQATAPTPRATEQPA